MNYNIKWKKNTLDSSLFPREVENGTENKQKVYPLGSESKEPRSDEESSFKTYAEELKRKKRIKLAIYIAGFAVFQTIVILVFALLVMRVKTQEIRLGNNVKFHNVTIGGNSTSPSFDINFTTQLRVKNANFGPYKYDSTIATFMYKGVIWADVTDNVWAPGMPWHTPRTTETLSIYATKGKRVYTFLPI